MIAPPRCCIVATFMSVLLLGPAAGQDVAHGTYIAGGENGLLGFGIHSGWLAATCAADDPRSQGVCLGVIWTEIYKLDVAGIICLPFVNVNEPIKAVYAAIQRHYVPHEKLMQVAPINEEARAIWRTRIVDTVRGALVPEFTCRD